MKLMKEYEFTLKFALQHPDADPQRYVEDLGCNGCDDALIGVGKKGYIALNFIREAASAYEAISSAVSDVKKVIPEATLVEETPDFVGLTDVAQLLGCTRQNVRKLIETSCQCAPAPVHEGKSSIWHLADILIWLREVKAYRINDELLEIAETNRQFNVVNSLKKIDSVHQDDIRALVA